MASENNPTERIIIEIEYRPNDAQANDFLTQLNAFIIGNQPPTVYVTRQENDEPHDFSANSANPPQLYRPITTRQEEVEPVEDSLIDEDDESQALHDFSDHPRGYRSSPHTPVLRGDGYCPHCLCAPCVIDVPPDYLRGQCGPHAANDEKRHRLYRLFWSTLKDLGVWRDNEYLQRKQEKTTMGDRRDIIPDCIIVEIRARYPSLDGHYRDYLSTFDAQQFNY